jgi:hypothetical protein
MTDAQKEMLYDLLVKSVTEGLTADEQKQLDAYDPAMVRTELRAFEMTAAAISIASVDVEPMPEHLFPRIADEAPAVLKEKEAAFDGGATVPSIPRVFTADDVFEHKPRSFIFGLLGWGVAALLLVIVGIQFYTTGTSKQPEKAAVVLPAPSVPALPTAERDELLRSAPDLVTATWAPGNMKDVQVTGDVVWSDAKQEGYIRLRGLPPNDPTTTSYQLWIFDRSQDAETPINGGVFDVNANGELIMPIHASLRTVKPEMFAVTMEKAGGVMRSKREKIAALAKVETQKS